jgi:hypothetical protein
VSENEKREKNAHINIRTLSPNLKPSQVTTASKPRLVLDKNEIGNYEKLTRIDY